MSYVTRQSYYPDSDRRSVEIKRKKSKRDAALFVDVGGTLTDENIHTVYARHLGYAEEEARLREKMKAKELTPEAFDTEIEAILVSKNFSQKTANEIAPKVRLRDHAVKILQADDFDIYIISLAPSFYIDWLITNKGRKDGVTYQTASKFKFNKSGLLVRGVETQNAAGKGAVVRVEAKNYLLSAGIGDDYEFDGDFLAHCTLAFLVAPNNKYLYSSDLNYILDVIRSTADSMRIGCEKNSVPVRRKKLWTRVALGVGLVASFGTGAAYADKALDFVPMLEKLGLSSKREQGCECVGTFDGQPAQER